MARHVFMSSCHGMVSRQGEEGPLRRGGGQGDLGGEEGRGTWEGRRAGGPGRGGGQGDLGGEEGRGTLGQWAHYGRGGGGGEALVWEKEKGAGET